MLTGPPWLDQALAAFGYVAVFVAVGLESTGIPFPGETALIAAAVYAGTGGPLNIIGVLIAAAAGAIAGDNTGYAIGRTGGYALLERFAHVLRLRPEHLRAAREYFARHGDKTVFFGRFVSILRTWVAFLAGVNHMPWRRFVFWNALGGIVWAAVFGTLGYALGRNLPLLDRVLRILGWGGVAVAVAVVAVAVAVVWWRRRVALRRTVASANEPPPDTQGPPPVSAREGGASDGASDNA
jgi:membrane protein DedA with SNARE-associated domain